MGMFKHAKQAVLCLDGRMVFLQCIVHLKRAALPEASGLSPLLEPKLIFRRLSIQQENRALA